jgi:hypothetical protein
LYDICLPDRLGRQFVGSFQLRRLLLRGGLLLVRARRKPIGFAGKKLYDICLIDDLGQDPERHPRAENLFLHRRATMSRGRSQAPILHGGFYATNEHCSSIRMPSRNSAT